MQLCDGCFTKPYHTLTTERNDKWFTSSGRLIAGAFVGLQVLVDGLYEREGIGAHGNDSV